MSRLGRDYLKVGFYTEVLFVEKGVRFIAINNGIDSQNQQDSDFTLLLNIINDKTHRQSYKIKKNVDTPKEQWKIFPNTHEPIVDEETFNRVQELRKNKRRPTRTGKTNMFSGIVRCADCREKMYYCTTKNFDKRQDHFVCSTSRTKGKEVCGSHFIRAVILEQGVLHHIRTVMWLVANHEEKFRAALGAMQKSEMKKARASKKKQVNQIERRIDELDRLFKKVYEDYANQRLSEARYEMLSGDYETEQAELREKLEMLTTEIEQQEEQADNINKFITKVKKYLEMTELTPAILNDLVKAVYVHKPKKVDGKRVVDIDISYGFVGILPKSLFENIKKRTDGITHRFEKQSKSCFIRGYLLSAFSVSLCPLSTNHRPRCA